MALRILAVDDEMDILRLLEYNLGRAGFSVITAADGPEALELARTGSPDLVLLDVMLPNKSGIDVLKALKKDDATSHIPVIMLTAKGEEIDRVIGFELGADDYIVKPFSPRELLLRVRAILKGKIEIKGSGLIEAGKLALDTGRFAVTVEGNPVKLTAAEFKILMELAMAKGNILTREYLLRKASTWEDHTTTRAVDTHIRRLRLKLGPCGEAIETERGLGYRLNPDKLQV